jgi:hydrogenase expression/formation protein HypC
MCIAVPGRIKSIDDGYAEIDYDGISKKACLRFFENAKIGDCVLVHAGFVIQIMDSETGDELEKLIKETMGNE